MYVYICIHIYIYIYIYAYSDRFRKAGQWYAAVLLRGKTQGDIDTFTKHTKHHVKQTADAQVSRPLRHYSFTWILPMSHATFIWRVTWLNLTTHMYVCLWLLVVGHLHFIFFWIVVPLFLPSSSCFWGPCPALSDPTIDWRPYITFVGLFPCTYVSCEGLFSYIQFSFVGVFSCISGCIHEQTYQVPILSYTWKLGNMKRHVCKYLHINIRTQYAWLPRRGVQNVLIFKNILIFKNLQIDVRMWICVYGTHAHYAHSMRRSEIRNVC